MRQEYLARGTLGGEADDITSYRVCLSNDVLQSNCTHTYSGWLDAKDPTCIDDGTQKRICSKCGHTEFKTIAGTATGVHTYAKPVQAGTKFTTTGEYSDGTNTAVIPAGFTVSGKGKVCRECGAGDQGSECSINDGLVVYLIEDTTESQIASLTWDNATTLLNLKKTYDQFVWIPMPKENINDMYMCQSEDGTKSCKIGLNSSGQAYCSTHKSTAMAGRLYIKNPYEGESSYLPEVEYDPTITNQTYTADSGGLREPDIVSNYDGNTNMLGYMNGILGTSYSTASDFKTGLQSEYNEIVKSVYENEGFYIGRYETSNITSTDGTAIKVIA